MQLYRCFVSQSSDFCRHNSFCCFSTSVCYCCLFHYRLSPETFGYTLVHASVRHGVTFVRVSVIYQLQEWNRSISILLKFDLLRVSFFLKIYRPANVRTLYWIGLVMVPPENFARSCWYFIFYKNDLNQSYIFICILPHKISRPLSGNVGIEISWSEWNTFCYLCTGSRNAVSQVSAKSVKGFERYM
jgi:hypothetical protein